VGEVLLENLIAHPLRGGPLPALDFQVIGAMSALYIDAPHARLTPLADRQYGAVDPEFLHRGARNALDILLFHTCLPARFASRELKR
jgi:hypothetical protein